jgi:hypothetical protein
LRLSVGGLKGRIEVLHIVSSTFARDVSNNKQLFGPGGRRVTVAVCLQCGDFKDRSSTPCPKCGYNPTDPQVWARQTLATDRYHNREELEALAARVKAGESIEFDPVIVQARFMREEIKRLTAKHGTVPPPWVVFDEHPYSICWRMGGGETHIRLWWEWWEQLKQTEEERVSYFRRWRPPYCWLAFLIEAVWGVERSESDEQMLPYFERTSVLGFGSQQDYERDLGDPRWLER